MNQHQSDDFEICKLVARDVTVGDVTRPYLFKEISAGDAEELFTGFSIEDPELKRAATKGVRDRLIAACVRRPDHSEFTVEQAKGLPNPVAVEFQRIAQEVNGLSGGEKKSKAANDSGTSSQDDLAEPSES